MKKKSIFLLSAFYLFIISCTSTGRISEMELLAEHGDKNAINWLGIAHCIENADAKVDMKKSKQYFQKLADMGDPSGLNNLAVCLITEGLSKNDSEIFDSGVHFLKLAAKSGSTMAFNNLGVSCLYYKSPDYKSMLKYWEKAIDYGNLTMLHLVGHCYENGIGTTKDPKKGLKIYEMGVDFANPECMLCAGNCYYYGIGTKINYKKAFELYSYACSLRSNIAFLNIACCYIYGDGIKQDKEKGYEFLRRVKGIPAEDIIKDLKTDKQKSKLIPATDIVRMDKLHTYLEVPKEKGYELKYE